MKDILESPEVFTAYATIDAGYYMIAQLSEQLAKPTSPLEAAIDKATGYDKTQRTELIDQTIVITQDVIEAKKLIGADYSADIEMLTKLQALKSPTA